MTCEDYREWAASDVDGTIGELAEEARAHLAGCQRCRRLRAETLAGRSLLRSQSITEPAPAALRERILAALDREAAFPDARRPRHPRTAFGWLVTGLAAAAAIFLSFSRPTPPEADPVIEAYELALDGRLALDHRTADAAELERYFAGDGAAVPTHVVDYRAAGLELEGGVVRRVGDRQIRLAIYRAGKDLVICDYRFARDHPRVGPAAGRVVFSATNGLSFCVRRMGDEVCTLISRMPLARFRALLST